MVVRRGLQTEVLVSLSLVMATATAVLFAVMLRTHETQVRQLRGLAARALLADAQALHRPGPGPALGSWWRVDPEGRALEQGRRAAPIDGAALQLAGDARAARAPMLRAGPPWQGVYFAAPLEGSEAVAVARLDPATSPALLLGLLLADVVVFTAFGAYLLRRRVVRPLQRLAFAVRQVAAGETTARLVVEGENETAAVASAFNDMSEALETRTLAVEKAVADLRQSNRRLREARDGLDRAERLAAVGRLAAGVAHEVGNPMGAMLAFLDLTGRDPGLGDSGREYLARAAREGERVRKILRQLLDFSRPPRGAPVPVDLREVAEEVSGMVKAQRRYHSIEFEIDADPQAPRVLADPGSVAQILLNLVVNAADALCAGTAEPTIRLSVRPAARRRRAGEMTGSEASRARFDAVECAVADNGPGIPDEDRERIFDPFFSTKDPGAGTGLGLSNAARFAEEFGGGLELGESPGSGAVFVLSLPAAAAPGDPEDAEPGTARVPQTGR